MFKRSQTVKMQEGAEQSSDDASSSREQSTVQTAEPIKPATSNSSGASRLQKRPKASRGDTVLNDPENQAAPPKTSIFESAGDVINPPLPPTSWILDPSVRARTIFHDRVYHPEDIPSPPPKRNGSKFGSQDSTSSIRSDDSNVEEGGSMRVEEKIARAYHKDLSWRKVLVRLEPDAHNNMVVRRMFANAYGWPVVKHICDTHFGDTHAAKTRDENEPAVDRAPPMNKQVGKAGEEVHGQQERRAPQRSDSEMREAADELKPLREAAQADSPTQKRKLLRQSSDLWDESYLTSDGDDDSDTDADDRNPIARFLNRSPQPPKGRSQPTSPIEVDGQRGTSPEEISKFLTAASPMDGHRGLSPTQTRSNPLAQMSSKSPASPTYSAAAPGSMPSTSGQSNGDIKEADELQNVLPEAELVQSPPAVDEERPKTAGSTGSVGLRKSIEEQMGSPRLDSKGRKQSSGSGGVAEQVARTLSTGGEDHKPS